MRMPAAAIPIAMSRLVRLRFARASLSAARALARSPAPLVSRSKTTAMITIASPASNAAPTSTCWSARMMSLPRPGASTSTVITTIERAIINVWLIPRMRVGRAMGSWTLRRIWDSVDPRALAASTLVGETPRIPRAVIRIAAGIA